MINDVSCEIPYRGLSLLLMLLFVDCNGFLALYVDEKERAICTHLIALPFEYANSGLRY